MSEAAGSRKLAGDETIAEWVLTSQASAGLTRTITARSTPNSKGKISEAILEVDRETKAIRRLLLTKNLDSPSETKVTFTLVESRVPEESFFEPAGHLAESHEIYSPDHHSEKRIEILTSYFGSHAKNWITTKSE